MSSTEIIPNNTKPLEPASSNKRIAKNAVMLYFRMFLTMVVGLYTSRVVLNVLGVVDYGIYAVVGGPVALFGFLNVAMASSTQRYLNFELGRGDEQRLREVFMSSTYIHLFISFLIVLIAETVGLWLLMNKMTIPVDRMSAAMWAYQISLVGVVIGIICTPYNATIIAHERMSAFAYISILDCILKLAIVYLIYIAPFDKLVFYAFLLLMVQVLMRIIYGSYCKRHFEETAYRFIWNGKLVKEMTSFALWNLWGNMATAFYNQGLNILLNIFFGPVVNAARSVATMVLGQSTQFAGGFQTAVNPQITKLYAQGKISEMHALLNRSCKFSFFLLLIIGFPVFLESPMILKVWLVTVPEYTVYFLRLSLCIAIVNSMARPLMTAAAATGKVKVYQSVVGGTLMLIVLAAYIVLKMGGDPVSVYIVQLVFVCIAFVVRLLILRPLIKLSLKKYFENVVFISLLVLLASSVIPVASKYLLGIGLWQSAVNIIVSILSVAGCCYLLGLTRPEREYVLQHVVSKLNKFKR